MTDLFALPHDPFAMLNSFVPLLKASATVIADSTDDIVKVITAIVDTLDDTSDAIDSGHKALTIHMGGKLGEDNSSGAEILIPILGILMTFGIPLFAIWVGHRKDMMRHQEIALAMEHGIPLPPEFFLRGQYKRTPLRRLGFGMICLALGTAFLAAHLFAEREGMSLPGLILTGIGLALMLWAWLEVKLTGIGWVPPPPTGPTLPASTNPPRPPQPPMPPTLG